MIYWLVMLLCLLILMLVWIADYVFLRGQKLPRFAGWKLDALLFAVSWGILFALNNHEFVVYNNYSYLTDSLLHGRLDTPTLPGYLESIELGGKTYMHFAPGVSLLLLPIAAVTGAQAIHYAYIGITLGAANAVLFRRVLQNLRIGRNIREQLWCTVFAIFGTVHCFCAAVAHSWFIGHVASWTLLYLSMLLATQRYRRRAAENAGLFFAGLSFGLCVCCRLSNLLGAGFFVAHILLYRKKNDWIRLGLLYAVGAAVFGGFYMALNYVRFGTIMDESYNLTHLKDLFKPLYYYMQENVDGAPAQMDFLHAVERTDWDAAFPTEAERRAFLAFLQRNLAEPWNYAAGIPYTPAEELTAAQVDESFRTVVTGSFPKVGGALSLSNAPNNLRSIFLLMPKFQAEDPYVIPTLAGVSLTFCSPLLYACVVPLWTRRNRPFTWVLLGSAVVCAVPFVLNYGNGFAQFGMRYAMDFLPYLLLLSCMGLTHRRWTSVRSALVLLCVLVNVWGPLYWRFFYLNG